MYFVEDSGNKHEINRALPAAILSAAAPRKAAMKSPFRRRLAEPGEKGEKFTKFGNSGYWSKMVVNGKHGLNP